jgi:hypothetical protein
MERLNPGFRTSHNLHNLLGRPSWLIRRRAKATAGPSTPLRCASGRKDDSKDGERCLIARGRGGMSQHRTLRAPSFPRSLRKGWDSRMGMQGDFVSCRINQRDAANQLPPLAINGRKATPPLPGFSGGGVSCYALCAGKSDLCKGEIRICGSLGWTWERVARGPWWWMRRAS